MKRRAPSCVLVLSLILILLPAVGCGLAVAEDKQSGDDALATIARSYVELFMEGKYDDYVGLMADDLKTAFPPTLAEQVLQQMLSMNGAMKQIGEAWLEDNVEVYQRFRVPTEFENKTSDIRVVFNNDGKVVGFFQVEHVPSPAQMAADTTLKAEPNPEMAGHWEGEIELPGRTLGVQVDLEYKDGYWIGAIDIPSQGAKGLPLEEIVLGQSEATFAISGVPGEPTFHGKLADGAITGEFKQSGQEFPFRLGREELARPARPQEPKPPFPYAAHEVSYTHDGIKLAGTLTVPKGKGPFPSALLLSGSGAQDRNEEIFDHKPFLVLADHLTRAGIAVLRVDDRGVGDSGGSAAEATSEDYAGDALAGVNFLRNRNEIDPKRIGLIGHSEGGILAPMVAAKSDHVAYVVMLAGPAVPGSELLVRQVELIARNAGMAEEQIAQVAAKQTKLLQLIESDAQEGAIRGMVRELIWSQSSGQVPEEALEEQVARETANVTSPWFRYFLAHDPRPALRELDVPVLALFGGKDLQVDPKQNLPEARKALKKGGNPDSTVEELAGLNHLFQKAETGALSEYYTIEETIQPAVLQQITEWILERFGGVSKK